MANSSFKVRWDEVDLNGHLRHTGYGAFCAEARVNLFEELGIPLNRESISKAAPVLLKEELEYRREVMLGEVITVSTKIAEATEDLKRWSINHEVFKADGELAAKVSVRGTWICLETRKVVSPSQTVIDAWYQSSNPAN